MRKMFLIVLLLIAGEELLAGPPQKLYPILHNYARELYPDYDDIPTERKYYLDVIADYIRNKKMVGKTAEILFVGTNQSTRSLMAQAWAHVAAYYYGLEDIAFHSAGINQSPVPTETIQAMERAGFIAYKIDEQGRVFYQLKYANNQDPIIIFPKKIDDRSNPFSDFMSVMVCPNATGNLSTIKGSFNRLELTYHDPLGYEDTDEGERKYDEICRTIALEMFYVFSQLKNI